MPKRTRNESAQKQALREMMEEYLKKDDVHIKDGADINSVMKDMMSVLLEGILDEELNEELGYSKYDYRNKDTNNSRNGHSSKTMHTLPKQCTPPTEIWRLQSHAIAMEILSRRQLRNIKIQSRRIWKRK